MLSFTFNRRLFLIAAFVVACLSNALAAEGPSGSSQATDSQGAKTPSFATVTAGVHKALTRDPEYRSGDLISASQVTTVLSEVKRLGWQVPDAKRLLERVPSDDEFLTTALKNERGRPFMRQVSKLHDGYDRVDRLSRMPQGRNTVEALIRGPDGYKMIEYMTTAKGGKELGAMLGNARHTDFNGATGRIYTEQQLVNELQTLYAKTAQKK